MFTNVLPWWQPSTITSLSHRRSCFSILSMFMWVIGGKHTYQLFAFMYRMEKDWTWLKTMSSLKVHVLVCREVQPYQVTQICHVKYDYHYKHQENTLVPVHAEFSLQTSKAHRNINILCNSTSISDSHYPWNNTSHKKNYIT